MQVIYNPRCSKCRKLEKELDLEQISWKKVLYLDGMDREIVQDIFEKYDGDWRDLIRQTEEVFKKEGRDAQKMSKEEMVEFVARHPIALQRPLVLKGDKVIIARDDTGIQRSIEH